MGEPGGGGHKKGWNRLQCRNTVYRWAQATPGHRGEPGGGTRRAGTDHGCFSVATLSTDEHRTPGHRGSLMHKEGWNSPVGMAWSRI